jgi:hypothetical protein
LLKTNITLASLHIDNLPSKVNSKLGMMAHIYNPSTEEAEAGELQLQGQLGLHSETLSPKKRKKTSRGWSMSQVVEHLPSKHKALSSNTSTVKKKKVNYKYQSFFFSLLFHSSKKTNEAGPWWFTPIILPI